MSLLLQKFTHITLNRGNLANPRLPLRFKSAVPPYRPLSPHLTVYKPQLTSTLSIFHRITGLGASVVLYAGGIGALFSTSQSFPEIVQIIQNNVPSFMILATKTAIGGSLIYHTLNGVRHLAWDVGYGFQLKHLYMSGYAVVALTAIGTILVFIRG